MKLIDFRNFSAAARRFMIRTCNGLELRDQIPPLPPTIALANFDPSLLLDHHLIDTETISMSKCRLHGNSKPTSTTVSPHHRVQTIDLMDDDIPIPFPIDDHTTTTPPNGKQPTTPIFDHKSLASIGKITTISSSSVTGTLASGGASSGTALATSATATTTPRRQFSTSIDTDEVTVDTKNVITKSSNETNEQKLVNISSGSTIKHRWHACPELHKAMDGVTYIADHTKREEESTRVSYILLTSESL